MRSFRRIVWSVVTSGYLFFVTAGTTASSPASFLIYLSGQSAFYSGQDYELQWSEGAAHWPGAEGYVIQISYADKIVLQQQVERLTPIRATLRFPAVKSGVRTEAMLSISAYAGDQTLAGIHMQPIAVYAKRKLGRIDNMFRPLRIGVLDFTEQGSLVQFLAENGIAATQVGSAVGFSGRWLFVAGADFNNNSNLFVELYALWQQGISIFVLPPVSGIFPLPPFQSGDHFVFSDTQVAKDVDPLWSLQLANGNRTARRIVFRSTIFGEQAGYEASKDGEGSSWIGFSRYGASLILCGWDLPAMNEESPVGILYLRHLLIQRQPPISRFGDSH